MSEYRYAKVINAVTKEVKVGVGCTDQYYKSIGMVQMNVERAYNNKWYKTGYAPVLPEPTPDELKQRRIAELKDELDRTDYRVIKCSEYELAGLELPYDIAELHVQRQALRDEINSLEQ